jgi:alpha-glucosidase
MHPSVTPAVKRAIELLPPHPYLWSLFERASHHHEPIIRPTFYDFPEDAECLQDCDEFMLGRELLVAPVVEAGATRAACTAGPGRPRRWFDFETGQALASGQWHRLPRRSAPACSRAEGAAMLRAARARAAGRHDDGGRDQALLSPAARAEAVRTR